MKTRKTDKSIFLLTFHHTKTRIALVAILESGGVALQTIHVMRARETVMELLMEE
jgi:hypothetical protein